MYFVHSTFKLREIFGLIWYYLLHSRRLDNILDNHFKELYGRKGIALNYGRHAFELIIKKFNLEGSEIIMPAYISGVDVAFINTLIKYNINPVFVDVDKNFNCNVKDVKKKINKKTSAIMVAYIYGNLYDFKDLKEDCRKKGILLIENRAHCLGANLDKKIGDNDAMFFSLYKNMPNISGGYLITKKKFDYDLEKDKVSSRDLRALMNLFVNGFIYKFVKFFKKGKVSEDAFGFTKGKRANILVKLLFCYYFPTFKKNFDKRIKLGDYMKERLNEKGVKVNDSRSIYFLFSLLVKNRDKVVEGLRKKGILATKVWYRPIVLNEIAIKKWKLNKKDYKNTVEISEKVINLPIHHYYSKKDVDFIVESLVEIIS